MEILKIYWKKQKKDFKHWSTESARFVLILVVHFYRCFLSGHMGGNCRYFPSCSNYALQALKTQALPKACFSIIKRLLRCYPFSSKRGYDPVPQEEPKKSCKSSLHS